MIEEIVSVLGWMQQSDGSRLRDAEQYVEQVSTLLVDRLFSFYYFYGI
jgi:hypothetical protein